MFPTPGCTIAVDVVAKQPWQIALHDGDGPRDKRRDIKTLIVTVWAIDDRPATESTVPGELCVYVQRAEHPSVADSNATMHFYYGDEAQKQLYMRSIRLLG